MKTETKKGFTLLEILLVIATIGILSGIVILAVNPSKQLADARNSQRKVDVNTILNALYQYSVDNNGNLPEGITNTATEICKTGGTCTSLVDLSVLTEDEKYLTTLPVDPNGSCNANGVCYEIVESDNGRITVSAPDAENDVEISATK